MTKAKEVTSIRLSKTTLAKIDAIKLASDDLRDLDLDRTKIIEEAIDLLYLVKTDQSAADVYLRRMESFIKDGIQLNLKPMMSSLNITRNDFLVVKELLKVIIQTLDLPQDTKTINSILEQDSLYEDLIVHKIMKEKGGL